MQIARRRRHAKKKEKKKRNITLKENFRLQESAENRPARRAGIQQRQHPEQHGEVCTDRERNGGHHSGAESSAGSFRRRRRRHSLHEGQTRVHGERHSGQHRFVPPLQHHQSDEDRTAVVTGDHARHRARRGAAEEPSDRQSGTGASSSGEIGSRALPEHHIDAERTERVFDRLHVGLGLRGWYRDRQWSGGRRVRRSGEHRRGELSPSLARPSSQYHPHDGSRRVSDVAISSRRRRTSLIRRRHCHRRCCLYRRHRYYRRVDSHWHSE